MEYLRKEINKETMKLNKQTIQNKLTTYMKKARSKHITKERKRYINT